MKWLRADLFSVAVVYLLDSPSILPFLFSRSDSLNPIPTQIESAEKQLMEGAWTADNSDCAEHDAANWTVDTHRRSDEFRQPTVA